MTDRYQPRSLESRWGCAAAALIFVPVFVMLLFVDAVGDCAAGTSCRKGFLMMVMLPSGSLALLIFIIVRTVVRAIRSHRG
jgi:hypothetical protein